MTQFDSTTFRIRLSDSDGAWSAWSGPVNVMRSTFALPIETMADLGMPLDDEQRAYLAEQDARRARWEAKVAARPLGLKVRLRLRTEGRILADRLRTAWNALSGKYDEGGW
jgi:hypothetical protein